MLKNKIGYLKDIIKHRRIVRHWCFVMGVPFRGILHDISKYSKSEFALYKYRDGKRSPHDNARDELGYSPSWCHHKARNKHHWEYWVDEYNLKIAVKIPFKYVIEMFCDYVGAGQVYNPKTWDESFPIKYHLEHKDERIYHPETLYLLELLLIKLNNLGVKEFKKWFKRERYNIKQTYKLKCLESRFELGEICKK